ncbi:MAG TPA: heme-binding beta-barrel domain-containing protein [Caulobacteraceae bacterium]|nr:heme-binding beta-barrel domain-containing protein [Caulobacteraceae bacterium]
MADLPADIFTEPDDIDPDTLANLGPLRGLAGVWEGEKGLDVNPKAAGPEQARFVERIELQPIDPQANGPQLFYGLRYHTHILKPGEATTYHDQVGYWLWAPASGLLLQSLAIPRGQVALAAGTARPDATSFRLSARRGATDYGICSTTFLEEAFRTDSYDIEVTLNPDGTWSYFEVTVLRVRGQAEAFRHEDGNTLTRIAEPTPNPLMRATAAA